MLKKLKTSGLVITLIAMLSCAAYSQKGDIPTGAPTIPDKFLAVDNGSGPYYYASLPTPDYIYYNRAGEADMAIRINSESTEYTAAAVPEFIVHRKYIRPTDYESSESLEAMDYTNDEVTYLNPMQPVVSYKTTIGVPPFGYLTYTEKPVSYGPIRDFRKDMWTKKSDKPELPAAYNNYDQEVGVK